MEGKVDKEKLKKDTAKYQLALERELDKLVKSGKNGVRDLLVIGGTLTVSYLLFKRLSKYKKGKKKAASKVGKTNQAHFSIFGELSETVLKELSVYLLSYAKEKILNYIDTLDNDE